MNAFNGPISRLDVAEERISELEGLEKKNCRTVKDCETNIKSVTYTQWEYEEKKERNRRNI